VPTAPRRKVWKNGGVSLPGCRETDGETTKCHAPSRWSPSPADESFGQGAEVPASETAPTRLSRRPPSRAHVQSAVNQTKQGLSPAFADFSKFPRVQENNHASTSRRFFVGVLIWRALAQPMAQGYGPRGPYHHRYEPYPWAYGRCLLPSRRLPQGFSQTASFWQGRTVTGFGFPRALGGRFGTTFLAETVNGREITTNTPCTVGWASASPHVGQSDDDSISARRRPAVASALPARAHRYVWLNTSTSSFSDKPGGAVTSKVRTAFRLSMAGPTFSPFAPGSVFLWNRSATSQLPR